MKTLQQIIGTMKEETKTRIIEGALRGYYQEVVISLKEINNLHDCIDRDYHIGHYNSLKPVLQDIKIWDSEFEKCYYDALERKLNVSELNAIQLK